MAADISIYISKESELCEIEVKYTSRQREQSVSWIVARYPELLTLFNLFLPAFGNDDSVSTSSIGTQLHSAIQGDYYKYFSSPISSSNNHTSWYKPHLWMHVYLYFYIFLSISDQTILISQQRIIFTKFNIARRYNESNSTPTKFST